MYADGWLQICLSAVMRGEDLALARLGAFGQVGREHELVEDGLVEPDLLGRHHAVVKLVNTVGQLGRDLRLGLRATEHQDAVERAQRVLGRVTRAFAVGRQVRDELRTRPHQPGVGEVEDGPEVAEPVLDRRSGEHDTRAGRNAT